MSPVINLTTSELRVYFRDPQAAFWTFFFNLLLLLVFGFIFGNTPGGFTGDTGFLDMFLPSLIGISICAISFFTIGSTMVEYREKGILKRYLVTPLKARDTIFSLIIVGMVLLIINAILSITVGVVVFDVAMPSNVLGLVFASLLSAAAYFSFGFFIFSFVSSIKAAGAVSSIILNFSLIFSGAFLPIEAFPDALQAITYINPLKYSVDFLQGVWFDESIRSNIQNIVVLFIMFIISTILATKNFKWV